MSVWWKRRGGERRRRGSWREPAPAAGVPGEGTIEEQIIERLRQMKLPEPPPGARERGLAKLREHLREQSDPQR